MPAAKKEPMAISWTTEDLYNLLMRGIEPDLCTDTLYLLDDMYEEETPQQRSLRMVWYAEAFEQFLERYQQFTEALHGEFRKINTALRRIAESGNQAKDDSITKDLEAFFRSA
jgi:uncharacterized protein YukE